MKTPGAKHQPDKTIGLHHPVSNHDLAHPVILTFKAIGGTMPTPKKTAAPKAATKKAPAAKKAAPKKAAPKKAPAKKAAPKPAPKPPAPPKTRSVYLLSNSGEKTFVFTGDKDFNAAMDIIKSAPSDSGGWRTPPTFEIDGYGFTSVTSYKVTEH
jgi:pyruvate/2-oxoglutarate dehydrogenase complex dihydrolipoamide acyltransferase (E2) component|tara:strand:+ start:83 stop:547 length:465 start_codon:yes stop_codon:yes gene_type:complete